jgi:hypothetical protein
MGLISLLETEGEDLGKTGRHIQLWKRVWGRIFHLPNEERHQPRPFVGCASKNFWTGGRITFKMRQTHSKGWEETFYHPGEVEVFKDTFTRFVFTGFQDHKRQYL